MELTSLLDEELLGSVATLLGAERELCAKLLAHLAEIESRKLHLKAGFSSMFQLCVDHHGMSEGQAFRRILAARLARRFPVIYSLVASGALHLSALQLLHEHLTEENHRELLQAASGKRKRKHEIEDWLARRFPKPDVPPRIRKLPERKRRSHHPCNQRTGARRNLNWPWLERNRRVFSRCPKAASRSSSRRVAACGRSSRGRST
ncbi:MAG TPA: hypothetical protein VI072_19680 [Polyangiaceae bacterium]